jgi:prephenate dehydrogenase
MDKFRAFACHSSHDSEYVLQVCAFLKRHMTVFTYEEHQRAGTFVKTIQHAMQQAHAFVIFLGETYDTSPYLVEEK